PEHLGEWILAAGAERFTPGCGDVVGAVVTPGEPRGDLLHLPEPLARLRIEALHRVVDAKPVAVGLARPPVDGIVPGLHAGPRAGLPRCARGGVAHGIAPGAPVALGELFEIPRAPRALPRVLVRHHVLPGR